jgi:DeoR family transcriptional regulator, aga operon transcriptional repressor
MSELRSKVAEAATLPARVRRARELAALQAGGYVSVAELASLFDVSKVTVRADLDELASRGLLRRVRGGAVLRSTTLAERNFEEAEIAASEEKQAIGRAAADLVSAGDTVILDGGTTTTAVAVALSARAELSDITVLTSSLTIAFALESAAPRVTVIVTGGTLRPQQHSLVEPLAGLILASVHAGTAFIGCSGVDVEAGVSNVNLPETEVKKRIISASQRRIVCADSSKLGRVALAQICRLEAVDLLITDSTADPALIADFEARGLEVQLVETIRNV